MPRVNVKDKRKQQLIDANMVSIAKRGLVDTTIAHVSDGANMSRGIVNFYFTSKEKMMQETLACLIEEQTACWQDALAASAVKEPVAKIEAMMRALMGDKLCSQRRLAVLSAFIGHAGTHPSYAKLINAGDELFIKQIKDLWQESGLEVKLAEARAKQMLAVVRGHHTLTFLSAEGGKPSLYSNHWVDVLLTWTEKTAASLHELPVKIATPSAPAKPAKKPATSMLSGQLDFGDLFAKA